MKQLIKKIRINTTLTVVTGLHIGGSSDNVEIGGVDSPVIKVATRENQPYIPGSSLKGKMRCLLEQVNGATEVGQCEKVNNLFGLAKKNMPSKLIVRDAYLTKASVCAFKDCDGLDMPFTESKYENTTDRVHGATIKGGIRQQERVPAGAQFGIEMIINVWEDDKADALLQMLKDAIRLIENDYLGGSGSRGYGQVKFSELDIKELSAENNWKA